MMQDPPHHWGYISMLPKTKKRYKPPKPKSIYLLSLEGNMQTDCEWLKAFEAEEGEFEDWAERMLAGGVM